MGLVRLATMAAMAIWRLPSFRRQPGCRPKRAHARTFPGWGPGTWGQCRRWGVDGEGVPSPAWLTGPHAHTGGRVR